jgi:hypothetical protein
MHGLGRHHERDSTRLVQSRSRSRHRTRADPTIFPDLLLTCAGVYVLSVDFVNSLNNMATPDKTPKTSSGSQSKTGSQKQASILGFFQKKAEQKLVVPKPDFKDGAAARHLRTPLPSSDPIEPASSPLVPSKSSFTTADSSGTSNKENGQLLLT